VDVLALLTAGKWALLSVFRRSHAHSVADIIVGVYALYVQDFASLFKGIA
jgi:hypothetical protein